MDALQKYFHGLHGAHRRGYCCRATVEYLPKPSVSRKCQRNQSALVHSLISYLFVYPDTVENCSHCPYLIKANPVVFRTGSPETEEITLCAETGCLDHKAFVRTKLLLRIATIKKVKKSELRIALAETDCRYHKQAYRPYVHAACAWLERRISDASSLRHDTGSFFTYSSSLKSCNSTLVNISSSYSRKQLTTMAKIALN